MQHSEPTVMQDTPTTVILILIKDTVNIHNRPRVVTKETISTAICMDDTPIAEPPALSPPQRRTPPGSSDVPEHHGW